MDNCPAALSKQIINREACDESSPGHGEYCSLTNPIPVTEVLVITRLIHLFATTKVHRFISMHQINEGFLCWNGKKSLIM